jgi:hypothetical protein
VHDAPIIAEDVCNLVRVLSLTSPDELKIMSPLMTPNLNSKKAVATERFLISSFPVPRLLLASIAVDLAMSLSEKGLSTFGEHGIKLGHDG